MSKAAVVVVLDLSTSTVEELQLGCAISESIAVNTLLFSPRDELALVFAGASTPSNAPLPIGADVAAEESELFSNIQVPVPLGPATVDILKALHLVQRSAPREGPAESSSHEGCLADASGSQESSLSLLPVASHAPPSNFIGALLVAAHLLKSHTRGRKYHRSIYFISDARHAVQRKERLIDLISLLKEEAVSLVVAGINFSCGVEGPEAAVRTSDMESWANLSTKRQNEAVLQVVCAEVGHGSRITAGAAVLSHLSSPQFRRVRQQPQTKISLTIGDIRIAVQLFTRTQAAVMPKLQRCTTVGHTVVAVSQDVRHVAMTEEGEDEMEQEVGENERVEGFFYGTDLIPCTPSHREAMKLRGRRSLETIGFAKTQEVRPYLSMGRTRTILPLAGDHDGQKGFNAVVDAMLTLQRAMLVRYTRITDAAPEFGVCFPHLGKEGHRCLFFAPLPFAEDVRHFSFSEYPELQYTAPEEAAMDALIDALTVSAEVLPPHATFHPVLQQFYTTLRQKLSAKAMQDTSGAASHDEAPTLSPTLLPLSPQLRGSSTAFFSQSGPIRDIFDKARDHVVACAAAFPFEKEEWERGGDLHANGVQRSCISSSSLSSGSWFKSLAAVPPDSAWQLAVQERERSGSPPSTVAAPHALGSSCSASSSAASTAPHRAVDPPAAGAPLLSSMDPAGSFSALVRRSSGAATDVARAKDALSELIWQLLQYSFKDALYVKCVEGIAALRSYCVAEADPAYYHDFLLKLQLIAQQCNRYDDFWLQYIWKSGTETGGVSLWPITARECVSSSIADDAEAEAFVQRDRSVPVVQCRDSVMDDILESLC